MQQDQTAAGSTGQGAGAPGLDDLMREIARLRRTLLKHGHAQELFQERVQDRMDRLANERPRPGAAAVGDRPRRAAAASLNGAQLRSVVELGQAVRNLKDLAAGGPPVAADESSPRSVREGLDYLEIRVSNLQRSFGLEPIPALGRPFDDRLHRAHGVCHRDDLPDGQVVEELLPGYLLAGEVERPALVIVNRLAAAERQTEERKAMR